MKILCLHGVNGNDTIIRFQLGYIMGQLKQKTTNIEFICPNSPRICSEPEDVKTSTFFGRSEPVREWWNQITFEGLNESIQYFKQATYLSTIDAVIGFSQGAAMITLLHMMHLLPKCKATLLICNANVQEPHYSHLLEGTMIDQNSVHLIGLKDEKYFERSVKGTLQYKKKENNIIYVDEGHNVPSPRLSKHEIQSAVHLFFNDIY